MAIFIHATVFYAHVFFVVVEDTLSKFFHDLASNKQHMEQPNILQYQYRES